MLLAEGTLVQNSVDGQAGTVVKTESGLAIMVERGKNPVYYAYTPTTASKWLASEPPGLDAFQVASVAYAADAAYRKVRGEYRVQAEFMHLHEADRMKWIGNGPDTKDPARLRLYRDIKKSIS